MTKSIKKVLALALVLTLALSTTAFAATTKSKTMSGGAVYTIKCEYLHAYSFQNGYVATCIATASSNKTTHMLDVTARLYTGGGTLIEGWGSTGWDTKSHSQQFSVNDCSSNYLDYYGETRGDIEDPTYGNWISTVVDKNN